MEISIPTYTRRVILYNATRIDEGAVTVEQDRIILTFVLREGDFGNIEPGIYKHIGVFEIEKNWLKISYPIEPYFYIEIWKPVVPVEESQFSSP